ncbi:putative receptor-like protein kinase At3g47110 isoform X3 [Silene latifolia]|uniref:putative receptor-like protein kinase At3g47110 isoform X3 n=1 Tax=Silene latifolia TaxID=37657 RepID=UPI003D76CAA3
MAGNFFQGPIPEALKTLGGLHVLDLSRNNFSGKIPTFLTSLHQLQTLNLSYNNLEGELPIDGVFNNASGTSLVGNNRLCGGIPEFKLPSCSFSGKSQNRSRHKIKLVIAILCGCVVVTFLVVIMLLYIFWHGKKKSNPTASADLEKFPNLSYQCLLKATNGFSAENMLGSGGFGVVYKGSLGQDNTLIAIKIFKLENRGASQSFMAECGVLRNIRHRNLIKVITACSSVDYQGRDFKALVYEYMVNGSLDDWLHPKAIKGHDGTNNPTKIRFQPKT